MDPSDILLTDQVAIVTGGGQGIGEGVALAFARFGAHVVIADRNAQTGERIAAQVRELGREGIAEVEKTVGDNGRVPPAAGARR